jgi:hypothetical protein
VPRASVWFVRAALICLGAGFTFGALLLLNKGLPVHPALWRLLPAHVELVVIGWTMNLALGVAYWILPRFLRGAPRGPAWPTWAAFGLLNGGVLIVCAGPWVEADPWMAVLGRVAQVLAAALFALQAWRRVKAQGV